MSSSGHKKNEAERANENGSRYAHAESEADPRVQMAAERTLLAWVRTGLASMAFGFVIARFALVLQSLGVKTNAFLALNATIIGVLLVTLGVITTALAPRHYKTYFKRMKADKTLFAAWSSAYFVAYCTAALGIAIAIYLLIVDFSNLYAIFGNSP